MSIYGTNFDASIKCLVGNIEGTIANNSATYLECTTPALSDTGNVYISLSNYGQDFTVISKFTVVVPPTVLATSPIFGFLERNSSIKVTGANFSSFSDLKCQVGGVESQFSAWYLSETAILCDTSDDENLTAGNVSVLTSFNGEDFVNDTVLFEYVDTPVVDSISPLFGLSSGETLTISGSGFSSEIGLVCKFNFSEVSFELVM